MRAHVPAVGRAQALVALACVVLFGVSLMRYWVSYDPTDTVPLGQESFRLARNLAGKGQFANPFGALETGPSAHLAPGYPAFLALLIRLFGYQSGGIYAIKLSAAVLVSLQIALFPVFSRALGMGALNGAIAAFLWIIAKVGLVFPFGRQAVPLFAWENLSLAILVGVAVCSFRRCLDVPLYESGGLSWVLGGSLGILALTSPAVGILFIGLLGWMTWKDRRNISARPYPYLVVVLLPALIVAPWMLRNYFVFHRVVFVRDSLGLELSVSNNDCATFIAEFGCFKKVHPNANIDEARKVLAYGEPKYNDFKLREVRDWIKTHPARFFGLSARRVAAFWFPTSERPGRWKERIAVYGLTVLSIAGLWILYQSDCRSAVVCMLCLGLFPLAYYVTLHVLRHRYPILWLTFLLGTFPITTCLRRAYKSLSTKAHLEELRCH